MTNKILGGGSLDITAASERWAYPAKMIVDKKIVARAVKRTRYFLLN
jgi:hypothetical protein